MDAIAHHQRAYQRRQQIHSEVSTLNLENQVNQPERGNPQHPDHAQCPLPFSPKQHACGRHGEKDEQSKDTVDRAFDAKEPSVISFATALPGLHPSVAHVGRLHEPFERVCRRMKNLGALHFITETQWPRGFNLLAMASGNGLSISDFAASVACMDQYPQPTSVEEVNSPPYSVTAELVRSVSPLPPNWRRLMSTKNPAAEAVAMTAIRTSRTRFPLPIDHHSRHNNPANTQAMSAYCLVADATHEGQSQAVCFGQPRGVRQRKRIRRECRGNQVKLDDAQIVRQATNTHSTSTPKKRRTLLPSILRISQAMHSTAGTLSTSADTAGDPPIALTPQAPQANAAALVSRQVPCSSPVVRPIALRLWSKPPANGDAAQDDGGRQGGTFIAREKSSGFRIKRTPCTGSPTHSEASACSLRCSSLARGSDIDNPLIRCVALLNRSDECPHPAPTTSPRCTRSHGRCGRCDRSGCRPRPPGRRSPGSRMRAGRSP